MDTHHARSPAVRARHHIKRLPNSAFEGSVGKIGIPLASTPGTVGAAEAGADPLTDSNDNGNGSGIGVVPETATVPVAIIPSAIGPALPTVNHSRNPVVASPAVTNTATSAPVVVPVTTPSTTSPLLSTPSTTLPSITSTSPVVPTTSSVPYVTDTVIAPLSSSSAASAKPSPGGKAINNAGASSKTSISGAAIGITVAVVGLGVLATVVFFVRKHFLRKREMRRHTWSANVFPRQSEFMAEKPSERLPVPGAAPTVGGGASAFGAYGGAMTGGSSPYDLPPPPMSYNSIAPSLVPGNGASPAVAMGRSAAPGPSDALVKCTFVPTLPDELSITTGETVRMVAEYDDGWCLCAKAGGEQGMVPLECLDLSARRNGNQGQGDWRNSRRASSLPLPRY